MNWFTRTNVQGFPAARVQVLLEQDGGCEHVVQDIKLAYVMHRENDSFGPVSSYVCCQACDEAIKAREGEEEHVCHDCKKTVKSKDGSFWKWYDFYAAQGDVPLFICNCCIGLPTHKARVARDKADYEAEFGDDDYVE